MKTMKKRGFTLVELLVVIAILAILATVSVVGYTSFIERANVSNDQTLASQLNSMLTYMKSDSNGDFYNAEINVNNIREVTKKVLEDGGLDSLIPQSLEHGYNFYFDLQEQEYVVMKDKDVQSSAMNIILNAYAEDPKYEVKLENSFTQGNRYFLVGTYNENSVLSQIVDAFYAFSAETDYATLESMVNNSGFAGLIDFVANSVIVTDDANYRLTSTPKHVIFVDGVSQVGTVTKQWDGTGFATVDAGADYVLVTMENGTLTIPNAVNYLAGDSLNVVGTTIVINKPASVVAKMAQANFSNGATIKLTDGTYYTADNGKLAGNESKAVLTDSTTAPTVELPLEYDNPVADFTISVSEGENITNMKNAGENTAYVATEVGSFNVIVDFKGENASVPATGTKLTWTVKEGSGITVNDKTLTFGTNPSATIVLTATSENGKTKDFTLYPTSISAGSIKVFDKVVASGSTTNVTLVKTPDKDTYTIAKEGEYSYINKGSITLNENITWTYSGTGVDGVSGTDTIKLTGKGAGVLTVSVGTYLTYTLNLTIEDTANFALQPKNKNNFTIFGNKNEVLVSDLFDLKGDIPAGAELVVFNGAVQTGDSYMTPKRGKLTDQINATVDNNTQSLTNANYSTLALQFSGEDLNNSVRIAVIHNGVRISEDITVKIANATNVDTWDELSANIANNVVFMKDIAMPTGNTATLAVGAHTLYGNGFKFDVTTGKRGGTAGIITLATGGTIRDIRIIGSVYSTFAVSVSDDYGTSVVDAAGGSIINSYIANCRSPLRIESGEVFVKDSVLFGGRYANIDMVGGKVTIQGKVATVAQPIEDASGKTVLGTGITVWFNNSKKVVNLDTNAELKQYNFIKNDSAVKASLPVINFYNVVKISTSDMFSQLFGSSYSAYHYKDSNGTIYVSAGVGALDKYMDTTKTNETLELKGFADGVYSGSVVYSYDIPMYSLIKSKLAEKGINSDPLQMDVRTLQPGNSANAKLFQEYLQLGTYYYPENYTFSNGSVHFKTFPVDE